MDIFPADGDLSAHFITCPVCRDTYNLTDRLPIYIPCGHTFCTQCATSLIANERFLTANIAISCPVCRKRHGAQRTKELPLGFPKNLQLITVVEKVLRGEKRVENARPRLQKIKCKDCQVEVTADSCVKCDCNGEEEGEAETQDLLKRDITKLICVDCANQSHKEHVFEDPKKIKKQYETRETAKNLVDSIDRVKEKMEKDLKEQQKSRKHLELLVRLMKKSKAYLENLAESQHLYKDKQMYFKALEEMEQNFDLMEEENKKRHKIFQGGFFIAGTAFLYLTTFF
uniref:RING-type domain-containing protein n=1 Tax=Caenorhabditis tropicalis TaxID=1561998 RepID=A0A1I7UV62_9PELO